jgi:HK97 family phage portal protein
MNILGLTITRTNAAVGPITPADWGLTSAWSRIYESFAGAWQRNVVLDVVDLLGTGPVFSCITLIASDIAKMEVGLQAKTGTIWEDVTNPAYSPVLRKPNDYQNRIQFFLCWVLAKLMRGNSYILKQRDQRGMVSALYPLDPLKVKVLIAPDGSVFYELAQDVLSGVDGQSLRVPARAIIHDLMYPLYHPLVGVAPIHACGLAATQGLKIRQNSSTFFDNRASLDGILVAPGQISEQTAKRLEDHWNANYAGPQNAGKIAALGDGLKFEPLTMTARDAEQSEQLKDSALEVCAAFHVPAYMVGYGEMPNYNNIEALNAQYYAQCLQILIESIELCLKEGLDLAHDLRVQFDLDSLLRMDTSTQMKKVTDGVRGGIYTPNEGRRQFNLPPINGGDTVFLQEQDHSLQALAERDAGPDPFGKATPPTAPKPEPDVPASKVVSIDAFKAATLARATRVALSIRLKHAEQLAAKKEAMA